MGSGEIPKIVVTEPFVLTTTPIDGIHRIEVKGDQALFTLYEDQASEFGGIERRLVAKFLLPIEAIPECIRQAAEVAAAHVVGMVGRGVQRALQMN